MLLRYWNMILHLEINGLRESCVACGLPFTSKKGPSELVPDRYAKTKSHPIPSTVSHQYTNSFNFIKNLAFPIGVAKTLEYGFVRQQYHWIGYDSAYNLNDKSSNASKPKSKSEKNEVNNFNAESTNKGAFQKIQVVSTSTSTNLFSLQTMKNAISLNLR